MSFLMLATMSCKKNDSTDTPTGKNVYTIAVISDLHYMDPSLRSDTSSAFIEFEKYDQRLPLESDVIMKEVIQELINAKPKPDLVLVPGDLSFDGEKISHESVAGFLKELTTAGIKVRVTDGNHDINFRYACNYLSVDTVSVPNIDSTGFKTIYANFGFSDALYRDPVSLSYVSEPLPGLWLLAIDACIYDKTLLYTQTEGGSIREETMTWALARLAEAKAKGKTVFGMMHHALLNHYTDQNILFPNNVIDNASTASDQLMNAGLKVMFTGHGHSSDIVEKTSGSKFLYDIETSSTIAYPCTYRMITYVQDSALFISTIPITHIEFPLPVPLPSGQSFQEYAKQRILNTLDLDNAYNYYIPPYSYPIGVAEKLAPRMRNALMAQMAGDEEIFSGSELDSIESTINTLGATYLPIRTNWYSLWNDLSPADNALVIFLKSGNSMKK